MARIDRVVRITPLAESDGGRKAADYRAGCLALSPKERIEAVRRLSRRVLSLNPARPYSDRMDRGLLSIVHDAL